MCANGMNSTLTWCEVVSDCKCNEGRLVSSVVVFASSFQMVVPELRLAQSLEPGCFEECDGRLDRVEGVR